MNRFIILYPDGCDYHVCENRDELDVMLDEFTDEGLAETVVYEVGLRFSVSAQRNFVLNPQEKTDR